MVGGLLTAAFGWLSIFLVNVPLGVAMIAGGLWRMPESAAEGANDPDWRGFAAFGGCLFLLVFGLVEGNRLGWSSGFIIGALAGAVLLGAAFARLARRPGALFDLDLLRNPGFRAATIAGDAQMTGMISGFNNTARQIGIAAGIGGLGAAFQSRTAGVALRLLSSMPSRAAAKAAKLLATSGVQAATRVAPHQAQLRVLQAGRVSMTSGLHLVELLGAVCAAVVSGCVLVTGRHGRRDAHARNGGRDVHPAATRPERPQPGGQRRSAPLQPAAVRSRSSPSRSCRSTSPGIRARRPGQ
jgi:hypothetical protein